MNDALLPVAGTLFGFLASFASTSLHQRSAFNRERATRWESRRVDVYLQYVSAVKDVFRCSSRINDMIALGDPSSREHAMEDLERAEKQRSIVFEGVVLLSTDELLETANRLNVALAQLKKYALRKPVEGEVLAWGALETALFELVNEFHSKAGKDLAITGKGDSGRRRVFARNS